MRYKNKKDEKRLYEYIIISVIIWGGFLLIINSITSLILKFMLCLVIFLLEKYIVCKVIYYTEKIKIVRKKYHGTHDGCKIRGLQTYDIWIYYYRETKWGVCNIENVENTGYSLLPLNRIFLQELLIENLIAIEYLVTILSDDEGNICIKTKSNFMGDNIESNVTIYAVMKVYEEYLCKKKLNNILFEYYDTNGVLNKIIEFTNNGKIKITFEVSAWDNIMKKILLWIQKCEADNIRLNLSAIPSKV